MTIEQIWHQYGGDIVALVFAALSMFFSFLARWRMGKVNDSVKSLTESQDKATMAIAAVEQKILGGSNNGEAVSGQIGSSGQEEVQCDGAQDEGAECDELQRRNSVMKFVNQYEVQITLSVSAGKGTTVVKVVDLSTNSELTTAEALDVIQNVMATLEA